VSRYIARAANVAASRLGDGLLIVSGIDSSLFSLNATARVLWEAADGVTPLSEIVARRICAEFAVSQDDALCHALALAEDLARHGILHVSDAPLQPPAAPGSGALVAP